MILLASIVVNIPYASYAWKPGLLSTWPVVFAVLNQKNTLSDFSTQERIGSEILFENWCYFKFSYPITEITKEKLREERERAAANVPLTSERAIMRKAKHEYQVAIDRINK